MIKPEYFRITGGDIENLADKALVERLGFVEIQIEPTSKRAHYNVVVHCESGEEAQFHRSQEGDSSPSLWGFLNENEFYLAHVQILPPNSGKDRYCGDLYAKKSSDQS